MSTVAEVMPNHVEWQVGIVDKYGGNSETFIKTSESNK